MRYWLLTIMLLLVSFPAFALVIDRDTTWQGELTFNEAVRVLQDVTLTIASGTKVSFADGGLEVSGTLIATDAELSGQEWDGLLLKGNDGRTVLSGCRIRNAKTGVTVKGGSPLLEQLELVGNSVGVEVRGKAGGKIFAAKFINNEKVGLFVKEDSTTSVTDCRFEQNGRYGAYLYRAKPMQFSDNKFYDNATGLMIAYHGSDPVVQNNRFEGNEVGIQVDRSARPTLQGNLLRENKIGLYAYRRSDPVVNGNRFQGNAVGVLVAYSSYPQIAGNDFVDNQLALKLEYQSSQWELERGKDVRAGETASRSAFSGQGMRTVTEADRSADSLSGAVMAKRNWWGQKETAELKVMGERGNPDFIHDGRDQALFVDAGKEYPLDKVEFTPWSETPNVELRQ